MFALHATIKIGVVVVVVVVTLLPSQPQEYTNSSCFSWG
jgi:hypothetical protein